MPSVEDVELSEIEVVKARIAEIITAKGYDANIEEIGNFVMALIDSVAALEPGQMSEDTLPMARTELAGITTTTEEAAGQIMDVAERVGELAETTEGETQEKLLEISNDLFAATAFQDLCGQRTGKVEQALDKLSVGLGGLASCVGDNNFTLADDTVEYDKEGHVTNEDVLLHGPQNEGEGNSQDDIDALLASFD